MRGGGLQNAELCSYRYPIEGPGAPSSARSPSPIQLRPRRALYLPGPAAPISRPPRSDSAGKAHKTVLAPRRSSGSDTPSWCQWSSADTGGKCYPEAEGGEW